MTLSRRSRAIQDQANGGGFFFAKVWLGNFCLQRCGSLIVGLGTPQMLQITALVGLATFQVLQITRLAGLGALQML